MVEREGLEEQRGPRWGPRRRALPLLNEMWVVRPELPIAIARGSCQPALVLFNKMLGVELEPTIICYSSPMGAREKDAAWSELLGSGVGSAKGECNLSG